MHRAAAMVELASAMVGYVDPLDAMIDRDHRVFRGGDALDHKRDLVLVLDAFDGAPVQRHLVFAAADVAAVGADETLGEVALAPAVMRGVHRETERGIAVGDGALDPVFDKGIVAPDIE